MATTEIKVGDRITLDGTEYEVKETCLGLRQAKRRAWAIRERGGQCSYRRVGGVYCILKKVPPPVDDYFFKF